MNIPFRFPLLFLLLLLTSCSHISAPVDDSLSYVTPEPLVAEDKYALPFTLPYDPQSSFHHCFAEKQINRTLSPLLYEGLYELDPNFNTIPLLVESESVSENGLQWTFTIKSGIFFWDGTELTSRIVASSLNEARSDASQYSTRFSNVRSITTWENTVTLELYTPNANLPAILSIPISYGGGTLPQGTGPYLYEADSQSLQRNPNWWQNKSLPQEILLAPTSQEGDLISAFDAGELSVLDADLTTSQVLGYSGNYQVWEYPSTHLFYLGVTSYWGVNHHPLLDLMNQVINRDLLVENILAGYGVATYYPVHPQSQLGQTLPTIYFAPLDVADQLLSLAEVSEPIDLIVHEHSEQKMSLARELASQLSQYEVVINIVPLPWEEYLESLVSGNFQLYIGEMYLTPDFDLTKLITTTGEFSFGKWGDSYLDELWNDYRLRGIDILNPTPIYDENGEWIGENQNPYHIFTYLQDDLTILPLFFKNGTMISLWGHLLDASPANLNLFYDLEHWSFQK